jgi:hypothetical protein
MKPGEGDDDEDDEDDGGVGPVMKPEPVKK